MRRSRLKLISLAWTVLISQVLLVPSPAQAAQVFNVKSFGAVGDGVKDDSNALLAAAAAANAVPGSVLLFPRGNYLLGSVMTVRGIEVVGENATLTSSSSGGLELSGSNTKVRDMEFAPQVPSTGGIGLLVTFATGFEVRNNRFDSGFADGMSVNQSSTGKITANRISMSGVAFAGVYLANSSSVSVHDNTVGGITSASAFNVAKSNSITISSNRVTGPDFGIISSQNSNDTYSNNQLFQVQKDGIDLLTDSSVSVSGNNFRSMKLGIKVSNVNSAELNSNSMIDCDNAINLLGASSRIDIRRNTIADSQLTAIIGGGVSTLGILNNTFQDVGGAVNTSGNSALTSISGNDISKCLNAAIVSNSCTGTIQIQNNTIRDCGLFKTTPAAVVYVNSSGALFIPITDNTYSGSTTNLSYFIWCVQKQPPAEVSGNRTNTGLPNRIGS